MPASNAFWGKRQLQEYLGAQITKLKILIIFTII